MSSSASSTAQGAALPHTNKTVPHTPHIVFPAPYLVYPSSSSSSTENVVPTANTPSRTNISSSGIPSSANIPSPCPHCPHCAQPVSQSPFVIPHTVHPVPIQNLSLSTGISGGGANASVSIPPLAVEGASSDFCVFPVAAYYVLPGWVMSGADKAARVESSTSDADVDNSPTGDLADGPTDVKNEMESLGGSDDEKQREQHSNGDHQQRFQSAGGDLASRSCSSSRAEGVGDQEHPQISDSVSENSGGEENNQSSTAKDSGTADRDVGVEQSTSVSLKRRKGIEGSLGKTEGSEKTTKRRKLSGGEGRYNFSEGKSGNVDDPTDDGARIVQDNMEAFSKIGKQEQYQRGAKDLASDSLKRGKTITDATSVISEESMKELKITSKEEHSLRNWQRHQYCQEWKASIDRGTVIPRHDMTAFSRAFMIPRNKFVVILDGLNIGYGHRSGPHVDLRPLRYELIADAYSQVCQWFGVEKLKHAMKTPENILPTGSSTTINWGPPIHDTSTSLSNPTSLTSDGPANNVVHNDLELEIIVVIPANRQHDLVTSKALANVLQKHPDAIHFVPDNRDDDVHMLILARMVFMANGLGRVRILSNDNYYEYYSPSLPYIIKKKPIDGISEDFLKDVRWKFTVQENSKPSVQLMPEAQRVVANEMV